MSTHETIIELDSVSKRYRKGWFGAKFNAIEDVSFSVSVGQAVGFIGHNGSGKSTTLRTLMGLQTPTTGTVRLQGLDPRLPQSRKGIAYVPESPLLYDHLSPRELLSFATACHGILPRSSQPLIDKWLDRLSLATVSDKRIRQFSKGMVQRTALAMALVVEPRFLILDEPLSGLDPTGRREVVEILSEYRQAGGGILFSSHVLTDVEVLADHFLFIHKGRIRVSGTPGALLNSGTDSYEIIIESEQTPPPGFTPLYGRQFCREVGALELEQCIAKLRQVTGLRLITIRSCNTLESAYFRFFADAEKADLAKLG